MIDLEKLSRRQIRYICFRLQNEAGGGAVATPNGNISQDAIETVKKHMEFQEGFGGWERFGKTWDVDEGSTLVVVRLKSSIYSDWNKILRDEAKDLPRKE
jgi:hypothetical protein